MDNILLSGASFVGFAACANFNTTGQPIALLVLAFAVATVLVISDNEGDV